MYKIISNLHISILILISSSYSSFSSSDPVSKSGQCSHHPLPERKLFYHNGKEENIKLLSSNLIESRLVASVFKILSTEVLGYDVKIVDHGSLIKQYEHEYDDDEDEILDTEEIFNTLSSCNNPLCNDYTSAQPKDSAPRAMLSLDLWLPPSYHVDTWRLLDTGQLGPALRYGWFMSSGGITLLAHWRLLTQASVARKFRPNNQQMKIVEQHLTTSRDDCNLTQCEDAVFTPPVCQGKAEQQNCAILFASHEGKSIKAVMDHIITQRLRVQVYFVGSQLENVLDFLNDTSTPFMVLHYTPSTLTRNYSLTPIMFPACKDPLLRRDDSDLNCAYAPNRLAKVVWSPVQNEAPALFRFIHNFGFSYSEYVLLLDTYNQYIASGVVGNLDYDHVACLWLNKQTPDGSRTIYDEKRTNFPFQDKPELYIGGIFPMSGNKYQAPELARVAQMAVKDVNDDTSILSNYKLVLGINDGKCEADVVMKRFIDIIKTKDNTRFRSTVGMLGPACSDTVEPIAGVSKHFRTVVISYSAEGSISSDNREDYPYFFRTIAENKQYKHAYVTALQKLGWRKVAALTQDGAKYSDYMSTLQDEFKNNNMEFIMNRKFPKEAIDMKMYLQDLKERGAKIIIGEFYASSARQIMCAAFKERMTQREGYVWFLPGWFDDKWYDIDELRIIKNRTDASKQLQADKDLLDDPTPSMVHGGTIQMFEDTEVGDLPDCTTSQMLVALDGHLSLVHSNFAPDYQKLRDNLTVAEWKQNLQKYILETKINYDINKKSKGGKDTEEESDHENFDLSKNNEVVINKYSGYVYDAVWLYAHALEKLVSNTTTQSYIQNLHSEQTVKSFVNIISNTDFHGVSGRINFHGRPSRLSEVKILQYTAKSDQLEEKQIGLYTPNYGDDQQGKTEYGKMTSWRNSQITWVTEDRSKPLDNPKECGILSGFATKFDIECQLAITIVFIIGFIILLLIIFIMFVVLKIRYEQKMKATEERMRQLGLLTPTSVLTLDGWEIPRDRVVINRKLGEGAFGTVYGGEAFFDEKGWVAVAVKTLKMGSTLEEKIDFLSEADMMKRFDHRNIVKLLGVCTRNEPVYTVMEFMLYGDLKTYLLARRHLVKERNREDLDEVSNKRLTCMAYDVAKGLEYLSELKYVHRDVACRNCLVNAGRTVKLADFGMTRPMFESDYYRFSKKGMLPVRWMSPESLTDGLFTPASDIWSYGVLLYEMITFGSFPFQGMSNNQVLSHVKSGNTLSIPQGIKPRMSTLLQNCWNYTSGRRPTAAEIVELLYENPRLVSPCIDVPLASVQIERSDEIELISKQRKPSHAQSLLPQLSKEAPTEMSPEDAGYSSSEYSPMHNGAGGQNISEEREEEDVGEEDPTGTPLLSTSNQSHDDYYHHEEEMSSYATTNGGSYLQTSSYVPPGYIVFDNSRSRSGTGGGAEYERFNKFSVSSL